MCVERAQLLRKVELRILVDGLNHRVYVVSSALVVAVVVDNTFSTQPSSGFRRETHAGPQQLRQAVNLYIIDQNLEASKK